jgi:predicted ribosome quality control (RQC) complex YloA/Tae2 family protein
MDLLILHGVAGELGRVLAGRTLRGAQRVGEQEYALRFDPSGGDCLLLGLAPPHPFLFRAEPRRRLEILPPDPFILLIGRELEGKRLARVRMPGLDRVVEMEWESRETGARILVAELLDKSANLLLLDPSRKILGYAKEIASAFRAPAVGEPYRSPNPRRGFDGITLDPARAREYLERFAEGRSPREAAAAVVGGLSPVLGADLAQREEVGADPEGALAALLAAARDGRLEPTLYTPVEPVTILSDPPRAGGAMPVLSSFPLRRKPFPIETSLPDPEEAIRLLVSLQREIRREREQRERLAAALAREASRLERLAEKLQEELAQAQREQEHQRFGDLILAHPQARVTGRSIVVPDLYDPEGRAIEIPADPALSAPENAERHYARARKLRRGAGTIRGRLETVREARQRARAWRERLDAAERTEAMENLEAELRRARLLPAAHKAPAGRPSASPEGDPGIRRFRTAEGILILVGKTAADNDRLTFHVSSPHDFWLHAAEGSGAHVVVRNPARLKELPRPVLISAARIAAYYSRSRGRGKVEVHYTLRKHVRKGRGFPAGRVTLRNHRTLEVDPGIPGEKED